MKDVKFKYNRYKKIQIAKGIIPAIIGLVIGAVSLWKTSTETGQDQMLSIIDDCSESGGEPFTATDNYGTTRKYYAEVIGD